jgi:hypothetical protein
MSAIRIATYQDIAAMPEVAISFYSDAFSPYNSQENMDRYCSEFYSLGALQKEFYEPETRIYLAWDLDQMIGFTRLREGDEVDSLLGDNTV